MTWWAWLLIVLAGFCVFLIALALLLPVRIFIHYLRKDNNYRATVVIGQGHWETRICMTRFESKTEVFAALRLAWWKLKVPVMRRVIQGKDILQVKIGWWKYRLPGRSLYQAMKGMAGKSGILLRRVKPFLKRLSVEKLEMEVSFGFEDPSITGIMAGGCWALAGLLDGMLKRFFTVAASPRIRIDPRFNGEPLRLMLEGEVAMPLFRWLQLWIATRKIGGVTSGTSSH